MSERPDFSDSIFRVVECLHEDFSGTSEGLPDEQRARAIEWLKGRLRTWQPSTQSRCAAYDVAVKCLIEAVLAEVE